MEADGEPDDCHWHSVETQQHVQAKYTSMQPAGCGLVYNLCCCASTVLYPCSASLTLSKAEPAIAIDILVVSAKLGPAYYTPPA